MSLFMVEMLAMVGLVFFSAVFSATETAYTSLTIQQLRRANKLYPNVLSLWEKEPHRVLATLLLSNNAVNAAAGVLAAAMASGVTHHHPEFRLSLLSLLFGFIVSCAILVFGEILPKVLARRFTVGWAVLITPLMRKWTLVVSPFARAASGLANALLLGRARRAHRTPFLSKAGLRRILTYTRLPSLSHRLIDNVMDFAHLTAKDAARPRTEVFAVSLNQSLERVVQNVIQSGYSRVPVYRNGLDDIVGIFLAKDLLVAWRSGTLIVFQDLLRPVIQVSPETPLPELLRLFRSRRQHLAVLRNSLTGRVDGLVTLQDSLSALVGKIREED